MGKEKDINRLQGAAHLLIDGALTALRRNGKPHILLACMPKSGSTFFAAALSEYPGFRNVGLVPDYDEREQELCQIRLSRYNHRAYVAQLHIRNSDWTQHLMKQYGVSPVVLVRDFADAVVSLRDHVRRDPQAMPMAAFTKHHRALKDADLEDVIVQLAMPWYLNFYAGWRTASNALIVNYSELIADPVSAISKVFEHARFKPDRQEIQRALERVKGKEVRFNVGISGRGRTLTPGTAKRLLKLLDSYPALRSDLLFQQTRQTLAAHDTRRVHV